MTQMSGNIEELVRKVETLPDGGAAVELVQALMALHADAIARMLEIAGANAVAAMAEDELVSSVLALHGLHPHDFETRVRRAIDKLQLHFDSRGAGIELLDVGSGMVRLRFTGSRPGSGAAAQRLIEDVLYEAAPEIEELVIEGVEQPRPPGFVPLSDLAAV
jgi:hypothetical protein